MKTYNYCRKYWVIDPKTGLFTENSPVHSSEDAQSEANRIGGTVESHVVDCDCRR